ncbi:transcriptional regulator [Roseivirga seohaensis]|uniref:Transcriptional regulator n=1 Tax=Roseivirga seohaensis TaxID=1914963 RepID=A0A150XMW7_9BACT|nr:response regulator [Roseivirga seohaensis]KYG79985.1 transcriptional regulator [Roseivirga seohaensis]|tara:strand:- start:2893 stop:3336 length:444 start_codon:yes stop_codon:yes gene_type:complete
MGNGFELLLADDDQDDCLFFEEALHELSVSAGLTTVNNGEALLKLLSENNRKLPNALFLDLNMPRKNGADCLVEIRQCNNLKELPIIIYSTSYNPEIANMLFEQGANYYIRKPKTFSNLKKVILRAIELVKGEHNRPPTKDLFLIQP